MHITVLAGGIGAARFLAGLVRCVPPEDVTAICNVGDDFSWHGLHVSPDIDSVIYTVAGLEGDAGWGVQGDTTTTLRELEALGEDAWFTIGDRDLATHVLRSSWLAQGHTLSECTARLATRRGLRSRILPVTDAPHPTIVRTPDGDLAFQEYFVQRRASDTVTGVRFPAADEITPAPGVLDAIRQADVVAIAPSNPFLSIEPLLVVPGVRAALAETPAPRVALSPIIGGRAVKGPAAEIMQSLGHDVSALGVARIYQDLVDVFVIDSEDASAVPEIENLGVRAIATDTLMSDGPARERVARETIEAARLATR